MFLIESDKHKKKGHLEFWPLVYLLYMNLYRLFQSFALSGAPEPHVRFSTHCRSDLDAWYCVYESIYEDKIWLQIMLTWRESG